MSKLVALLKAICIMIVLIIAFIIIDIIISWNYYLHISFTACTIIAGVYWLYRQMRPKKRYYFVLYSHGTGFGACYIHVTGLFICKDVVDFINNNFFNGDGSIVVLNYKEITKEENEAQLKGGDQ